MIDHRPAVVEERSRLGDWEGDLIIGTKTRSAIGTLVDRNSGYVLLLLHLPSTHTEVVSNTVLTDSPSHEALQLLTRRALPETPPGPAAIRGIVSAWRPCLNPMLTSPHPARAAVDR